MIPLTISNSFAREKGSRIAQTNPSQMYRPLQTANRLIISIGPCLQERERELLIDYNPIYITKVAIVIRVFLLVKILIK